MFEVTMPKLSDSMEEGKILEWRKKEGDYVEEGDIIAEIESDKAAMELECFSHGVLKEIAHKADDVVPVGEVIAVIDDSAERESAGEGAEKPPEKEKRPKEKKEEEVKGKPEAEEEKPRPLPEESGAAAKAREEEEKVAKTPEKEIPTPPESLREKIEISLPADMVKASPNARALAAKKGIALESIKGSGPGGRILARDIEKPEGKHTPAGAEEAAPSRPRGPADLLALELAEKFEIDIKEVEGTGKCGRVTTADILAFQKKVEEERLRRPDEEIPEVKFAPDEAEVEEASFTRKTIARMVVASKHVIPHFYVTKTVDATKLLKMKDEYKKKMKLSITHLLVRAAVRALQEIPEANWSWDRGRIIKWKKINIGLAIQTDEGLTVAVLRDAGAKKIEEIVKEARQLVERAKKGRLRQEDRTNATFTISNLGMFDVESFVAIINPPSSCTLAVASSIPSPVVVNGKVEVRDVMKLTMSCDHRIIDGVTAANLLGEIKRLVEHPRELVGE
jgi:pyruvate dehydrogenase E2 component (dihydrolipoamide acetyltransferase)